jgi:hypothetical protein
MTGDMNGFNRKRLNIFMSWADGVDDDEHLINI